MRPALHPFRRRLRSSLFPAYHHSRNQQFHTNHPFRQQQRQHEAEIRPNFYRTHGRAFFKAITLAFLTYQVVYWAWLTLETEDLKTHKNREIKVLEDEVRLLDERRRSQGIINGGGEGQGSAKEKG